MHHAASAASSGAGPQHPGRALDPLYCDAHLLEVGARAPTRADLDIELYEALGELVEAGLVVDGDQGAFDHADRAGVSLPSRKSRTASGRSLCSTCWIRACKVSAVSPSRISTAP